MALADEITKLREKKDLEEKKMQNEIENIEKTLFPNFTKYFALMLHNKIKDRILNACSNGAKDVTISEEVYAYHTHLKDTNDGYMGSLVFRDRCGNNASNSKFLIYHNKANNNLNLKDILLNNRMSSKNLEISVTSDQYTVWLNFVFFNMFKITKKKGLLNHTYKLESGKLKLLFDEAKTLAEKDGIELEWLIELTDKKYWKRKIYLPFDSEAKSDINADLTKGLTVICKFNYKIS